MSQYMDWKWVLCHTLHWRILGFTMVPTYIYAPSNIEDLLTVMAHLFHLNLQYYLQKDSKHFHCLCGEPLLGELSDTSATLM